MAGQPDFLAVLKLHYLRWNFFKIKGDTYFQYMGIFDTDFDKYTEDAVGLFAASGLVRFSKIWRVFRRIGKQTPLPSSTLSESIIARASLNTANTRS